MCCFHTFKDVSLLRRAGTKGKAKANMLRTAAVKKRQVDGETNAEIWTPSNKRHKINASQDDISHKIDVSKQLDGDFNFPQTHMMSLWVAKIPRYGALQQSSADRHEQANRTNLKDGWYASNHNLDYLPQVITFLSRLLGCEVRAVNLQALAQRREDCAATSKVLPAGRGLAGPLSL